MRLCFFLGIYKQLVVAGNGAYKITLLSRDLLAVNNCCETDLFCGLAVSKLPTLQ